MAARSGQLQRELCSLHDATLEHHQVLRGMRSFRPTLSFWVDFYRFYMDILEEQSYC